MKKRNSSIKQKKRQKKNYQASVTIVFLKQLKYALQKTSIRALSSAKNDSQQWPVQWAAKIDNQRTVAKTSNNLNRFNEYCVGSNFFILEKIIRLISQQGKYYMEFLAQSSPQRSTRWNRQLQYFHKLLCLVCVTVARYYFSLSLTIQKCL